jgi:acyl carrier protein
MRAAVLEALAAVIPGAPVESLDHARLLRDQIDVDSLDYLNFVLALESRFSVRIPPVSYPLFASVDLAVDTLSRLVEESTPSAEVDAVGGS